LEERAVALGEDSMDRKEFIGRSLRVAAGLGLACPCVAGAEETPGSTGRAEGAPASCGKTAGDYPHATTFEERSEFAKSWVGRFVRLLDERLDEKTRRELMEANGRVCATGAYGPPDPTRFVTTDELVKSLAAHVGDENCRREGSVVYFTYRQNRRGLRIADGYCLCPVVEDGPKDLSPTYCQCSVGYVGYMFERSLGRPVRVELLESLRRGGQACRFAVHVA
jgi:hypothetical protein